MQPVISMAENGGSRYKTERSGGRFPTSNHIFKPNGLRKQLMPPQALDFQSPADEEVM